MLQMNLLHLGNWSQDWLMTFNIDEFKVMHTGLNNNKLKYEMNGKYLEDVTEEREVSVIIQNDLKCLKAGNTANIGSLS